MASDDDERTSDDSGETSEEELGLDEASAKTELDEGDDSAEAALDFGSSAESESKSESEPKSKSKSESKSEAGDEDEEAAAESESKSEAGDGKEEATAGDGEADEEEAYDPNKIPPLSERAMLFGAWGCVGLLSAVVLIFFVLIKSAIDKIDDYGAVADETGEPQGEQPPDLPDEPEPRVVTRTLEWATAYPAARAAARIDLKPIVIVFTAEYATESIDVFDGVFTNDDVENYLERHYQVVHVDMGAQGAEPDPAIALCGVEFLPHVCYVHPETEAKLGEDTTGIVSTSALLRDLGTALSAYEASTEAE